MTGLTTRTKGQCQDITTTMNQGQRSRSISLTHGKNWVMSSTSCQRSIKFLKIQRPCSPEQDQFNICKKLSKSGTSTSVLLKSNRIANSWSQKKLKCLSLAPIALVCILQGRTLTQSVCSPLSSQKKTSWMISEPSFLLKQTSQRFSKSKKHRHP